MERRSPPGPTQASSSHSRSKEIAAQFSSTGGPIAGHFEYNADGAGVSFGTHICDVEVDPETGAVKILRYTVVQDAGKAVHPSYVEGQMQGGAVQGIGWALNEEYVYGADGRLQNPGFLDYRIPVASDVPMIDAVIVETPNPGHPVWCARRRRDADRAAARGCRQRHCCRRPGHG
jgi:CO/xanthine dehydrogenase Mo-binding subunit